MSRARETWNRVEAKRAEVFQGNNEALLREWKSISQKEDVVSGIMFILHRLIDAKAEECGTEISVDLSFLDSASYDAVRDKLKKERYYCLKCTLGSPTDVFISWDKDMANL